MTIAITRARSRAHLTAAEVFLARGGRQVLTGVYLTVSAGDRLGVVGENGRGKTTLLQVLTGALTPDSGEVRRSGSIGVADQEMPADAGTVGDLIDRELADVRAAMAALESATLALADESPGADDAYAEAFATVEALDAWDADRRLDVALAALDAVDDRGRKLSSLSVGQRYRIRLAGLLGAGHDLLLLDEPTNHLDSGGLEFLTQALREHPGGAVIVTHDRALLGDIATAILDLDPTSDGRPRTYGGGYTGYRDGKRAERERWEQLYDTQRDEARRLADDLSAARNRLSTGWRPDKGTGKHTRATRAPGLVRAVHRRQEALAEHTVDVPEPPRPFRLPALPAIAGTDLIRATAIAATDRLTPPVDLALRSGDRLVVSGANGSGKSTLLAILAGVLEPDTGAVRRNPSARVRLLAQESSTAPERRAFEAYEAAVGALVTAGELSERETVSLAQLGLLPSAAARRPVNELSVGQRRRLDLAITLAARPHVLLVDEVTNHLSMSLVEELTEAFTATAAAVVVATHDRQLLRDTATWERLHLR